MSGTTEMLRERIESKRRNPDEARYFTGVEYNISPHDAIAYGILALVEIAEWLENIAEELHDRER